jgi:hypothetical protein
VGSIADVPQNSDCLRGHLVSIRAAHELREAKWTPEKVRRRYDWLWEYDATTAPVGVPAVAFGLMGRTENSYATSNRSLKFAVNTFCASASPVDARCVGQ